MRDLQSGPTADTGESQLFGLSQATRDRKLICSQEGNEMIPLGASRGKKDLADILLKD